MAAKVWHLEKEGVAVGVFEVSLWGRSDPSDKIDLI
jgi:hypothetical protein